MNSSIELTQEEGQVLINLINIAVKSNGLEVAEAGIFFLNKIKKAFEPEVKPDLKE